MAYSIIAQIGTIKGESAGAGPNVALSAKKPFADQIDGLGWSWGISQQSSSLTGQGGGAGKAEVKNLTIKKYVDFATPTLLNQCNLGVAQVIEKDTGAILNVFKSSGTSPIPYLVIKLHGTVMITSVTSGEPLPGDMYGETVTLSFSSATVTYTIQKADNSAAAANEKEINVG